MAGIVKKKAVEIKGNFLIILGLNNIKEFNDVFAKEFMMI